MEFPKFNKDYNTYVHIKQVDNNILSWFIVEHKGFCVASVSVEYDVELRNPIIKSLFVNSDYRDKKLASYLNKTVEDYLIDLGFNKCYVKVLKHSFVRTLCENKGYEFYKKIDKVNIWMVKILSKEDNDPDNII